MEDYRERRKHERYAVSEGSFAGITPRLGQIETISLGGLSFRYIDLSPSHDEGPNFVICGNDGAYLEHIPCTILSDQVVSGSEFSLIITKRQRIRFDELNENQLVLLKHFIRNNCSENM